MTDAEYASAAADLRQRLHGLDRREAVAMACRGSGDPAALAWLAESLELGPGVRVLDLGGGTGGPAAWLADHYEVDIVVADPSAEALSVAADVLGLPTMAMQGAELAVTGAFDAILALGVVSVVDDELDLLTAMGTVARRCGLLVWCSTGDDEVKAGGSRFPTVVRLRSVLHAAGWQIEAGPEAPTLPVPTSWRRLNGPPTEDSETEVTDAIEAGALHPRLVVAKRGHEV